MLEDVKKYLRITSNALNDDIESLIKACNEQLSGNGVDVESKKYSEFIKLAIKHFCKAHMPGEELEKHSKCYESLESYLMNVCRKDESSE